MSVHDFPAAAPGLVSYRYPNRYGGWIMIGAKNDADALNEARRSTSAAVFPEFLQVWKESTLKYVPAKGE